VDINASDEIVGYGVAGGATRAFLVTDNKHAAAWSQVTNVTRPHRRSAVESKYGLRHLPFVHGHGPNR
jgi:hypothetical protein